MTGHVLLGGYASKQCARRVHNEFDRTIPKEPWNPPPELQARFDGGLAFEALVFDRLESALGERCVRLSAEMRKRERVAATLAAMNSGAEVILEGQLPDEEEGGRVGKPDVLVRWSIDAERPTYLPADVKHHRTAQTAPRKSVRTSRLGAPTSIEELPGLAEVVSARFDDFVQLAHYTRMVQACGFHPGEDISWGAIIGTDDLSHVDVSGSAFVWHDLAAPLFATYSRSAGRKKRTALERYDHEHGFRLKVAEVAASRIGISDDPPPLVVPIWQQECDTCPFHDYCAELLGPEAASMAITSGRLDVREWLALGDAGITTTVALADLDLDDAAFRESYLPLVSHQSGALDRLAAAVERARMIRDGESLRRTTTGPLDVPVAELEIDFDIEWDVDDRVYLWGARVRRTGGQATYQPVVSWEPLDEHSERRLAEELVGWLRETVEDALGRGESVAIFHYASPEPNYLKRILGEDAVADLLPYFVDLLPLLRANFTGVHGLGIKKVAPALGFDWRDNDPGGLQSQGWLVDARSAEDESVRSAARRRLLEYNEDDVAATAAIRDGLRTADSRTESFPAPKGVVGAHG